MAKPSKPFATGPSPAASEGGAAAGPPGAEMGGMDELFGYIPDFVAKPGAALELKVSTTRSEFNYELVRLVHGDTDPAGPGLVTEPVAGSPSGHAPGRIQRAQPGSYGEVFPLEVPDCPRGCTVEALIWPTTPVAGRRQTIVEIATLAGAGPPSPAFSLAVSASGHATWAVSSSTGESCEVTANCSLSAKRWYRVAGILDCDKKEIALVVQDLAETKTRDHTIRQPCGVGAPPCWDLLRIGAAAAPAPPELPDRGFFNGKIEAPRILGKQGRSHGNSENSEEVVAAWDFSRGIQSTQIEDVGPAACHGHLINAPTRGVTGHTWNGTVFTPSHAPEQYGAVHFHDDDLDDARWETDAIVDLPGTLSSGIYAVRLTAGRLVDHVPVFVGPAPVASDVRLALLIPTFTYLAYANDRITENVDYSAAELSSLDVQPDWREQVIARHPEFGDSLYATHTDGSGVCYSSMRRPILTVRPDYRSALTGAPRLLGADLYITSCLDSAKLAYDVITDHDLHDDGSSLLNEYDVVVTGSHPEYASEAMLDGLLEFRNSGGALVYLGGNGFYWTTSVADDGSGMIEVRRGTAGTRTWECEPGEGCHSTTGEQGGLWRHRGRPPNALVGVGFTSQGWDEPSPGYRVTPAGRSDAAAFIFDGVDIDGPIGAHGRVLGGAAGYEIDRADVSLGTPEDALVVASSRGDHSDRYQVTVEEVMQTTPTLGGTMDDRVRADMTYVPAAGGGEVFAVGSLSFSGSLPDNNYDNDCARIVANVVRTFLDRASATRSNRVGKLA